MPCDLQISRHTTHIFEKKSKKKHPGHTTYICEMCVVCPGVCPGYGVASISRLLEIMDFHINMQGV